MPPLVIAAALKDEVMAFQRAMSVERSYRQDRAQFWDGQLEGQPLIVGYTGIGQEATQRALTMLSELVEFKAVIGTGYAGALSESLETGSLVLAHEVCRAEPGRSGETWSGDASLLNSCRQVLSEDPRTEEGRLVTVKQALTTPETKRAAAADFAAIAVDMESAALARFCHERSIPFLVLRAVLDPVSEKVPDPGEFLDREKRISKRKIMKYVARNPQSVWELPKLGAQAKKARQRIAEVMPKIVQEISS